MRKLLYFIRSYPLCVIYDYLTLRIPDYFSSTRGSFPEFRGLGVTEGGYGYREGWDINR